MLQGGKPERLFAGYLRRLVESSETILDVGTSCRFAKELRPYEHLFAGKRYVAAGYEPELTYGAYNCDCHQDVERMTFADGSFDAVICLEVLEHVRDPFRAAAEIERVLAPGGTLLLTVPFLTQYHGKGGGESHSHGSYPDFWRFTFQGLQRLFSGFATVEIAPLDGPIEFRLKQFYLTRFLGMGPVRWLVDAIDRPRVGKATSRHLVFATRPG
jgi:SAM-dependent methyltransferase